MDAGSAVFPAKRIGLLDRVLPLRHWLGEDTALGLEEGQARTRLICTLVGLLGFVGFLLIDRVAGLPVGIVATASAGKACYRFAD